MWEEPPFTDWAREGRQKKGLYVYSGGAGKGGEGKCEGREDEKC